MSTPYRLYETGPESASIAVHSHRGCTIRWSPIQHRWLITARDGRPLGWSLSVTGARQKVDRLFESGSLGSAVLAVGPL